MKIYFAGSGGKKRSELLYDLNCNRLFSYFIIIDKNSGYGEIDRFKELIERIKIDNE